MSVAQFFVRSRKFVLVITGVGIFGFSESAIARVARRIVFSAIRLAAKSRRCHLIFENASDQATIGLKSVAASRTTILMGAGVDPDEFPASDLPETPPFRLATVSRLVWSKGVDLAARAVSTLTQQGHEVTLDIYGLPDQANPRPIDPTSFSDLPGVRYHGFTGEIAEIWKFHHAGIFPSRGGEGLPRALLEASMCGRPSIVSNVPGCVDFIREGIDGYVVPADSEEELRKAILKLSASRDELLLLGKNARQRVLATSTTKAIQAEYEAIFRSVSASKANMQTAA
ncbi:glycosyltransferase [Bradyrhizobium septentrionale]|uniref:Glycosyltransferase n=1 Tax=Bradyrhizobium septentrionale TaxID=1404411 RepID=A0ABZ2NR31_9BRAD